MLLSSLPPSTLPLLTHICSSRHNFNHPSVFFTFLAPLLQFPSLLWGQVLSFPRLWYSITTRGCQIRYTQCRQKGVADACGCQTVAVYIKCWFDEVTRQTALTCCQQCGKKTFAGEDFLSHTVHSVDISKSCCEGDLCTYHSYSVLNTCSCSIDIVDILPGFLS